MAKNDGSEQVIRHKVRVLNKLGLHARPAAMLVQALSNFPNEVTISKGSKKINAKSIMGVMMLAAGPNSILSFDIYGEHGDQVKQVVDDLFKRKFDEE